MYLSESRSQKNRDLYRSRFSGICGCSEVDLVLSLQRRSHVRLTRSPPPKAGIGKVVELA